MLASLILSIALSATAGEKANLPLEQKKIHQAYNDGNFEIVTHDIELFQKTHKTYSESDSIFIAKHLAVVYSANPATREKGKYYMFRLLEMLPSAKLIDMYVSDEIDRIFEKVREEFVTHQKDFGVDSTRMSMPERAPVNQNRSETGEATSATAAKPTDKAPEPPASAAASHPQKSSGNKTGWIAAGVGVVTVGLVAAYFISSPSSSKTDKVYDVP